MFILPWKLLFFLLLISGSLVTMSASSWLVAWIGLEINLLAFLALALHSSSPRNSESILKYFLIQALASSILIASAFPSSVIESQFLEMTILLSLIMKLGAAPFHFWVPQILGGSFWENIFLILTWQKVAPFFLIISSSKIFYENMSLTVLLISVSAIIGGLGGLNQSMVSKILAYSSINHMSWMLAAVLMNIFKWSVYFFSYSLILLSVINFSMNFNVTSVSSSSSLPAKEKSYFFITLLSFGGLPPFFGFLPKWVILGNLIKISSLLSILLVLTSLLTLFFYLRLSFSAFLQKSLVSPSQPKFSLNSMILLLMNLLGLSLIALV